MSGVVGVAMTLAEIVDPTAVWQTIVAAVVSGLGVTLAFSIAVFGVARSVDAGRSGRATVATGFAALAALAVAISVAAVVVGVIVMTSK